MNQKQHTVEIRAGIALFSPSFRPWEPKDPASAIAVLMSGGVDSSVTALLLREAGWDVAGITMKIPVAESCRRPKTCCGAEAAFVALQIGIPHYFLDVEEAFRERVIKPFQRAYQRGATPNPCIECNSDLKFTLVQDYLERRFGVGNLATGHYARTARNGDGGVFLSRAQDRAKDQTYFLAGIRRERLPSLRFPLGEIGKDRVREIARERRLEVAEKPESMELCFAAEGDYRNALGLDGRGGEGPILDGSGKEVGRHRGIENYTVGQRRNLGVATGKPAYVRSIDPEKNTITVGTLDEVSRREVSAEGVNVLIPEEYRGGRGLFGKIRSSGAARPCVLTRAEAGWMDVEFEEPQFAPAPGQYLVLYDGQDRVVAGGTIRRAEG